jgi:hypothetical protein
VRKETERERRKKWNGEIRIGTDKGDEDGAAVSCYCLLRKTRGSCLQQEVAIGTAVKRQLQSRNRAAPEEEDKGNFLRTCL